MRHSKVSAALELAGKHVIYEALRLSAAYREPSARDRIIASLGRHVARSQGGLSVDFNALLATELASTYQLARRNQQQPGHSARRGRDRTAAYLRRLWTKIDRYLAQPAVKRIVDELVADALPNIGAHERGDLWLLAEWRRRRIAVPVFDAVVARSVARDRQVMIDQTLHALAELQSEEQAA